MPESQPIFPEVDRIIHEPARLAVLTVLSACDSADFTFLQAATGLSKGNLSVQLTKLEKAGLVSIDKVLFRKTTRTTASLSKLGKHQLTDYWATLERIRKQGASKSG